MTLQDVWGIRAPTAARGKIVTFDVRKHYKRGSRGPEPIPRGTPMPMTMAQICLFLLGV